MIQFDCSDLFPKYDAADACVIGSEARIRLWTHDGEHQHLVINVDKISNFLERCRQQQDPRIHHLA